jgi:NADP-dependent 3-hydroxy acid dehydrogenase YdfG
MKVYVIGKSRGLGKHIADYFIKDGYDVSGFDRTNGYDIEKDHAKIISQIEENSLVILNAYANGVQKKILENLINTNNKIVVMGTVAARYPDSTMVEYSQNKKELDDYFMKQALEKKVSDLLIINLTGKVYKDSRLIYDSIKFWLLNTDIIAFSYRTK